MEHEGEEPRPFWTYSDLMVFIGLAVPALLMGTLVVKAVLYLFHWKPKLTAAQLLPGQFVGYLLLFAALYLILKLQYQRPFWKSMGWVPSRASAGAAVVLGFALALAVGVTGGLLRTPDLDTPLKQLLQDPVSLMIVGAFSITLGPLCEELGFRGFMQPLLVRSLGPALGIIVTAIPFGLLHLQQYGFSWRHALLITLTGVAFGSMRYFSRSTRSSTLMHAAYNSVVFLSLLMQRKVT